MYLLGRWRILWAIPIFAALLCNVAIAAEKGDKKMGAKGGKEVTVTGCLTKGDDANEYAIKGDDGKTYGLYSSDGINLADHVNHKVTVTGKVTKERAGKKEAGKPEESEHLRVTDLKMISSTCS
jgi:hypothetical protein